MSFGGLGGGSNGMLGTGVIRIGAVTQGLRGQVRGAVNEVRQELSAGARQIEQTGKNWNRAFSVIGAAAKVGVVGVVAAMGAGLAASISYEQAFAGVIKTTGAAPAVLAKLSKGFRELSTEIPITANELAQLGETAGALGVPVKDIQEFVRVTALIGKTTNVSADQAATSLGQLSNVLDLTGKDYEKFASTLVDLGNKGASTESQILEIASRAGAVGHTLGLSNQSILAFSSAIANLGIESEAGGTALQFLFQRMAGILANKSKLAALADVAGTTGKAFSKMFLADPQKGIIAFLRGLSKLDPVQQAVALDKLGLAGARTSRAYIGLASSLDKNLIPALGTANEAWAANNALQNAADIKFKTTASQLSILKNRITNILISLGDVLLPGFNELVKWLSDKIPKAAEYLAGVWTRTLGPAAKQLADGVSVLLDGIGQVLSFGKGGQGMDGLTGSIDGLVGVVADLVGWLAKAATFMGQLAANPVINMVLKLGLAWAAFRLAVSGSAAAVGRLNGMSRNLIRFLTFGKAGGATPAAAAASAEQAKEDASVAKQSAAAAELSLAAKELMGAALALKGGALAGDVGGLEAAIGKRGPIQMVPGLDKAPAAAYGAQLRAQAGGVAAGEKLAMATATGLAEGAEAGAAGGALAGAGGRMAGLRSAAGTIVGGAAKLFWPLIIADLGIELLKAPIGGFIEANTSFKRVGRLMKEDFFGGLIAGVQAASIGSDAFVGRAAETVIGNAKFSTLELAKLGITNATFDKLESPTGTILNLQGQAEATTQIVQDLSRGASESVTDWFKRVQKLLPPEIAAEVKKSFTKTTGLAGSRGPATTTITDAAVPLITGAVSKIAKDNEVSLRAGYSKAISAVLKSRGFTTGDIATLTTAQMADLGKIIQLDTSGKYSGLVDLLGRSFLDGINPKTGKQVALSASTAKAVKELTKTLGKNWQSDIVKVLSGKPQGADEKATAKALAKVFGKDWQEVIRQVYRELHPAKPAYAGTEAQGLALGLKQQTTKVTTAIREFISTVPDDISQGIDDAIAASGETDPEVIASLRKQLEQQWHDTVAQALGKFREGENAMDPTVVAALEKKFGKDWVTAFRTGAAELGDSKDDKAISKELARVFGTNWQSILTTTGELVYESQGGADKTALAKKLAAAIQATVKGLTVSDLTPKGGKTPTKGDAADDRKAIAKYLSSAVGKAAVEAAASPDAAKAKQGFDDIGKALAKNIPNPAKRDAFIRSLVALQQAASVPGLDTLTGVLKTAFPTAAAAIQTVSSATKTLYGWALKLAGVTHSQVYGPPAPSSGGGKSSGGSGGSSNDKGKNAAGIVFDTTGETSLTVGEAGREHVAVVRSPKRIALPSASGGMMAQMLAGFRSAAAPSAALRSAGTLGDGARVAVHAQNLNLVTPADRRSVDAQLAFLAPDGR